MLVRRSFLVHRSFSEGGSEGGSSKLLEKTIYLYLIYERFSAERRLLIFLATSLNSPDLSTFKVNSSVLAPTTDIATSLGKAGHSCGTRSAA